MTTFGDYNKYIDTFYKVAFKDPEVAFYSYIDVKDVEPYFVGFVHIHDVISEPEDGYTSFRTDVLKVESFDEHKKAFRLGRAPAFGDYINKEPRDIVLLEEVDKSHPMYKECAELFSKFEDLHKNSPYVIHGYVYGETPQYSAWDKEHACPDYELIDEKSWHPENVHSLDDAERWLLENHPDYYMGHTISQQCICGNFRCTPKPGNYYEDGNFETFANRRKYAQEMANQLNVALGPKELEYDESAVSHEESLSDRLLALINDPEIQSERYYVVDGPNHVQSLYLEQKGNIWELSERIIAKEDVTYYFDENPDAQYAVYQAEQISPKNFFHIKIDRESGDVIGDINEFGGCLETIIDESSGSFAKPETMAKYIASCCDLPDKNRDDFSR